MTTEQQAAVSAWNEIQAMGGKIVFEAADLTPKGKRTARIVGTDRGGRQLRWYVSGRLYRWLAPNAENIATTQEWMA